MVTATQRKTGTVMIYQAITPEGEALWPEERSLEWLQGVRRNMPDAFFNAQYQNDPKGLKGVLFNVDHLQYYLPHELPPLQTMVGFQGGDSAVSKESHADYYGHATGARDPATGTVYVLGVAHERYSSPEHRGFLKAEYDKWTLKGLPVSAVQVEYWGAMKGSGQELMERERNSDDPMPLQLLETTKSQQSKQDRLMQLRPHFNGRLLFPGEPDGKGGRQLIEEGHWKEFFTQFASYPRGRHDDILDALWVMTEAAFGHTMAAIHKVTQKEHDKRYNERMLEDREAQMPETDNLLDADEPRDADALAARKNPLAMLYSNRGHYGREMRSHPAIYGTRARRRIF